MASAIVADGTCSAPLLAGASGWMRLPLQVET